MMGFVVPTNRISKLVVGMGVGMATGILILFYSSPFTLMNFIVPTSQQGFFVGGLIMLVAGLTYLRNDPSRGTRREDGGEVEDVSSTVPVPTNRGMKLAREISSQDGDLGKIQGSLKTIDLVTAEASLGDTELTSIDTLYEIAEHWGIRITKYRKGKVKKTGDRGWVVAETLKAMQTHNERVTAESFDSLKAAAARLVEGMENAKVCGSLSRRSLSRPKRDSFDFGDARDDVEETVQPSLERLAGEILLTDEPETEETEEGKPPEFIMIEGKPYKVSEIQATIEVAEDGISVIDLPDEGVVKRLPKELGDLYMALPSEMKMEIRGVYNLTSEKVNIVPLKTLEQIDAEKYINARQKRRDYRSKREQDDTGESEDVMTEPPPGERRKGPLRKSGDKKDSKKLVRKKKQHIKPRPKRKGGE